MPGVRCTRSRVCKKKRTRVSNHRYTANSRHSLRDGFTAYTWSPRGPGFLAPVVRVMRSIIANLTPASGRQDHTTSPSTSSVARPRKLIAPGAFASTAFHTQRP